VAADPKTRFAGRIGTLILDAAGKIDPSGMDAAIDEAINIRFSSDRPRLLVSDIQGNASNDLPLPTGPNGETWEDGFSNVESIEFPIGNVPESMVDNSDYKMYRAPATHDNPLGIYLRMLGTVPQASDELRVSWTIRHTPATVPAGDFEAVCCYAAALCFGSMAASYIQSVDAAIPGDTVNYRTKAQECLTVAKDFRTRYFNHIGAADAGAAGGSPAQPPALSIGKFREELQPGMDRLLHGKYSR
jgi:hypothetical protein